MACPFCRDNRGHPDAKSFRVNLSTGKYYCHHCEEKGCIAQKDKNDTSWHHTQMPTFKQERTKIPMAQKLKVLPAKPEQQQYSANLLKWFKEERGISEQTLRDIKVTEGIASMPMSNGSNEWQNRNTVQFNYYKGSELINTKFRTGD